MRAITGAFPCGSAVRSAKPRKASKLRLAITGETVVPGATLASARKYAVHTGRQTTVARDRRGDHQRVRMPTAPVGPSAWRAGLVQQAGVRYTPMTIIMIAAVVTADCCSMQAISQRSRKSPACAHCPWQA